MAHLSFSEPQKPGTLVRLNASDWRLLAIALLVSAVSLFIAFRYFYVAFPEASIDFRVSRGESAPIAQHFLATQGLSTAGYRHAALFSYDDAAKVFLEREVGLEQAQHLLATRIRLWRWQHRWFRPLQKEEFRAAVTPDGQFVGFAHEIDETAAGAHLSQDAARTRAEQFLRASMHIDPSTLTFVGSERQERPHRTDYTFTWKDTVPLRSELTRAVRSRYFDEANYRREVRVQGDQIGGYREYLHVPDQWSRDYERLRGKNNTAGAVDAGLLVILMVALLAALIDRIRRGDVRWRVALAVGGTGAVLSFLAALNEFPLSTFGYDTAQPFNVVVSRAIFLALLSAIGVGILLCILTAAAEALYRERFPNKVSLAGFLSWRGVRTKTFMLSVALGIGLAFFFFAYQTIFYIVANHFGAWSPAEVPYDDLLNTRFPWIFVLLGGFFPAISEEFVFRMFAIPLFERWFRFLWVAVVAASFLWGFGHATYPNQPFYIRGVEVGVAGMILSWIMLRFNILTTVVWHYTVDAIYTSLLLLRSHNTYLRLSGATTAFIAALPLLFAIAAYVRYSGFTSEAGLTNADEGTAPPLVTVEPELVPVSYARTWRRNWTIGIAIAAILLAGFAIRIPDWPDRFHSTPPQAQAAARAFLSSQGFTTAGYQSAFVIAEPAGGEQTVAANYIFRRHGLGEVIHEFSQVLPGTRWNVRLFRPLQEEQFIVAVEPDGKTITGFAHVLPEAAPGGSPSLEQARSRAQAFLLARGLDVRAMDVKAAVQERLPARTDSRFEWEDPSDSPRNVDEFRFRVRAALSGDHVSQYGRYLFVPDERIREWTRTNIARTVLMVCSLLAAAALIALFIWTFVRSVRSGEIRWRPVLSFAVAALLLTFVSSLNRWPAIKAGYADRFNTQPWTQFVVLAFISLAVSAIMVMLAFVLLLGTVGHRPWRILEKTARRQWARDAAGASVLALLWAAGAKHWTDVINDRLHGAGVLALPSPPAVANLIPGVSEFIYSLLAGIVAAIIAGVVVRSVYLGWKACNTRQFVIVGLLLLCIAGTAGAHSLPQWILLLAISIFGLILAGVFAWWFLRDNPLSYLSTAFVLLLTASGISLLRQRAPRYEGGGAVLLAIAVIWLVWLLSQRPGELVTQDYPVGVAVGPGLSHGSAAQSFDDADR